MVATTVISALGLSASGLLVAHNAWKTRQQPWLKLACVFALWALSTLFWCHEFGVEVGIPLALETGALIAFAGILLRAERRPEKAAKDRVVPRQPPEPHARLRGLARFIAAGPLSFFAAVALSVLIATEAPMNEQTRLVIAGLSIPTLWALLVVGALMARRPWKPGLLYIVTTGAAYALTLAGKA